MVLSVYDHNVGHTLAIAQLNNNLLISDLILVLTFVCISDIALSVLNGNGAIMQHRNAVRMPFELLLDIAWDDWGLHRSLHKGFHHDQKISGWQSDPLTFYLRELCVDPSQILMVIHNEYIF